MGTDVAFSVIARDKATKTFKDIESSSDRLGNKMADFAKKGALAVAGFAAAGAAAVTALAAAGTQFALEKSKVDTLLAGQLGVGPAQAKELGKVTGALYTQGWADSAGEAADAIRATIQNKLVDPSAGAAAIEAMSTRTAAAAQLMQEDVSRISSAVSQMLRTGMVASAEEAFDLLTVATQRGVNKSQDLLDTMNEYGTQFRQIGLDGPTAFGLMSQAIQAGARDADTAADALKEFAIRAIDGSTASAKGFALLGLDARKMTAQIAQGGEAAAEGLATVLARLRGMKDPVTQNAAAIALFGTKAEDLGAALLAMDPAQAFRDFSATLGGTQGAMDRFIESQSSAGQRLDKIWRGALKTIADKLLPVIDAVIGKIEEWASDPELQAWLADLEAEISKIAEEILPLLEGAWKFFMDSVMDNKDDIGAAIKGLVIAVGLLLAAILALGAVTIQAAALMRETWRATFNAVTGYIGFFVDAAAAAFGWVPELGPKLQKASDDFAAFRDRVNAALDGIKDKTIKVNVTGSGARFTTGGTLPFGGGFQERAHGGPALRGVPYIVGEHRPELFVPDQSGVILPSVPSGGGSGGSAGTTLIQFVGDGTSFGNAVLEVVRKHTRVVGRGNVQLAFGR